MEKNLQDALLILGELYYEHRILESENETLKNVVQTQQDAIEKLEAEKGAEDDDTDEQQ